MSDEHAPGVHQPQVLEGRAVAIALTEELRRRSAALAGRGVRPALAVVRAGDDAAARSYARRLTRTATDAGVTVQIEALPSEASETDLVAALDRLAGDAGVH